MKKLNIYMIEYWFNKGYNEEESKKLVDKWKKETSCRCKEFWMKRGYTEEESINKVSEYQRKTALKQDYSINKKLTQYDKEYWIKKGIIDETEINKKIDESKFNSNPYPLLKKEKYESMMNNRKKTYYSKSEDERKEINRKRGKTKEQLIEKHGYDKANDMVKSRGCNKKFTRRYSKISKMFFDELKNKLLLEKLNYGKNEKWIRGIKNKGYFVDFYIEGTNKIIEFQGDFFHANPKIYESENIIKISKEYQPKAKEIWENDQVKINFLKELNYDILIIWEYDVINNKENEIERCINFIKK